MRQLNRVMFSLGLAVILVVIACGSPAVPAATPTQQPTPTLMPTPELAVSPAPTLQPATSPPPTPTSAPQPAGSSASTTAEATPPPASSIATAPMQVTLSPSKDNTLYEDAAGSLSNGAGQHFFAGNTSAGSVRRGVIAFDIAGNVPAGATINSVTLTLHMSRTSEDTPQTVALHKLLADWGEGTSDAPGNEGSGVAATPGDATWLHRFFDTDDWAAPGGDFAQTASASIPVAGMNNYTWGPTPEMTAEVQGWLDDPSSNFGWLLKGNEEADGTAKRFESKENKVPKNHPVLTVEFTPPGG
jgi:hypothetical protein